MDLSGVFLLVLLSPTYQRFVNHATHDKKKLSKELNVEKQ